MLVSRVVTQRLYPNAFFVVGLKLKKTRHWQDGIANEGLVVFRRRCSICRAKFEIVFSLVCIKTLQVKPAQFKSALLGDSLNRYLVDSARPN